MKNSNHNDIYIAWDIGGAYTKYAIEQNSQVRCYVQKCELWKNFFELKDLISRILKKFKNKKIINLITMSGEMCDIFENREIGVKKIINHFKSLKSTSYIFTKNKLFFDIKSNNFSVNNIASMNWIATSNFLANRVENCIGIDIGSTTTDIILIKNNKIINRRINDFTGLINHELLYSGILRTPIYALTHEIKYRNKKYKIIPENFANMSDIYRLLAYLKPAYDYSSTSDNRSKSNINNMKRLSRIFGFDYHSTKKDLLFMLSKKIFTIHMDHISSNIKYHLQQKYVKTKDLKIVGIGIGKFLIRLICKKNNWRYIDFNEYCTHKTVGIYQPSDIAPAYSLIPLLSNYEKNT